MDILWLCRVFGVVYVGGGGFWGLFLFVDGREGLFVFFVCGIIVF